VVDERILCGMVWSRRHDSTWSSCVCLAKVIPPSLTWEMDRCMQQQPKRSVLAVDMAFSGLCSTSRKIIQAILVAPAIFAGRLADGLAHMSYAGSAQESPRLDHRNVKRRVDSGATEVDGCRVKGVAWHCR
jgi:hypothetical protein